MCIVSTVRSERAVSNDLSVLCVNKVKLRKKNPLISRQLFAGHGVGSRPMKGKGEIHRMVIGCDSTYPEGHVSG